MRGYTSKAHRINSNVIVVVYYREGDDDISHYKAINTRDNGTIRQIRYLDESFKDNHPNNKPSVRSYRKNGSLRSVAYYANGVRQSFNDMPQVIAYDNVGNVETEQWVDNEKFHRIGAPAVIYYIPNINQFRELWFIRGVNIRAPADAPFPFVNTPFSPRIIPKDIVLPQIEELDKQIVGRILLGMMLSAMKKLH